MNNQVSELLDENPEYHQILLSIIKFEERHAKEGEYAMWARSDPPNTSAKHISKLIDYEIVENPFGEWCYLTDFDETKRLVEQFEDS